jgi:hypothetical protein
MMFRSTLALIALTASAMVCAQNLPFITGLTWALIHGGDILNVLVLVPAAIAITFMWAGLYFIKKKIGKRATPVFALFAAGVVACNEWLLPATPLKTWSAHRALEGVRVFDVRDEPLLSAHGNPIGVRISFQATVPRTGAYIISAATLTSESGDMIEPLQFAHVIRRGAEPPATAQRDSPYEVFQANVAYTFSEDMLPWFIGYDEKTKTPCLAQVSTKYISEVDVLSALAANRQIRLRTEILVEAEHNAGRVSAAQGITSRHYDMQAIYDTIATEGWGRCKQ